MKHAIYTNIFCSLLLPGCFTPARERVGQDQAVGHVETTEYHVEVKDGLAVIREHSSSRLVLWQSAPAISVTLAPRADLSLTVEIHNTMPGGQIHVEPPEALVETRAPAGSKRVRLELSSRGGDAAAPENITLRLEPAATSSETFRFALMSDVQEAIDRVGDLYERINEEPDLDFLLGAGDLTERGTNEELSVFEDKLSQLAVPYYATLGNHELGVDPCLFQNYFGRGSLSFEHRGARFTLLDSASATLDPTVYDWLDGWLALGRDQFHIVAMHIPPIDPVGVRNGSFASRTEARKLLQRLSSNHVDLTLYGHVHSFYDFDNAAIPAVISGGGGAIPERFDDVGRHFVVFEVNPDRGTFEQTLVAIEPD